MNDEQRFDRSVRSWLDDGPSRAPVRTVEAAISQITTTPQERDLRVPWRTPPMTFPVRIAALAVVVALLAAGAAIIVSGARTTSPPQTPPPAIGESPTPAPATENVGDALAAYAQARNTICDEAESEAAALRPRYENAWNADAPEADRMAAVAALADAAGLGDRVLGQLRAMDVPPEQVADHAANIAHMEDLTALIRIDVSLLQEGRLVEAVAIDRATEPIAAKVEQFERRLGLHGCP